MSASRNIYFAVFGICGCAIAIDRHVGISIYSFYIIAGNDNLALFNLREESRIVESGKNIFAIEWDAPLVCACTSYF